MAKSVTKYSVFLASPSDLEEERTEIAGVLNELNLSYGNLNSIMFELIKWETHSAPGITNTYPQDLINKDVGSEYDIFIGLVWQKFGTKTKLAESGTEEEFLNALARFKNNESVQILFYFKNTSPKNLDEINIDELSKIRIFKSKLQDENILFWTFNNIDELKSNLRLHIPKRIEMLKRNNENSNHNVENNSKEFESSLIKTEDLPNEEDYGLFDYAMSLENLLADSNEALKNITHSTEEMGNEISDKAKEITRISQQPNANRFQMLEVLKRISKIMNNYSDRLKIETPIFYDNFKEAMDMGLKYMNLMADLDENNYRENLETTLEEIIILKESIPQAINGMKTLHDSVISMPRFQADINLSKRKLDTAVKDLIEKLESAYKFTSEFVEEIKIRIVGL